MKRIVATLLVVLSLAAPAAAADTLGLGLRAGAVAGHDSHFTEAFADLYLSRMVSVGATVAYVSVDRNNVLAVKRDESVPVSALFKLHLPFPLLQPYAGLGAALVFHDKRGTKATPVALAGTDLKLGPLPLFLNLEYRRQLDDELNLLGAGIGIKF